MATPADPLTISGTLEPDSTRNSTLHGDESMLKEKIDAHVESVEGKPDIAAQDDDFPDGGLRAWLVVGGAMCSTFATFGYVNSWGVFQAYYQTTVLSSIPPSNIAWIGSIQYSLVFLPSIFVGRLFDLGYFRSILVASSALLVTATFLIPHCTQYWQFILCQGFAVGLPCGCIFAPTASAVAHWFKKRRGLAMGFVAVGSSLGGTLLPIAAKQLLPQVGFKWTMRIIGFVLLAVLGSAILLMKRRLPGRKVAGGLFNWRAFRYAPFSVYCLSAFVTFQGVYAFLTYVAVSATEMGLPRDFAFYFVSFANAASLFGRYTAGMLADGIGPMNVMIPFTAAAGFLTYAWPYANSKGSLIAVTLLYGFASGAYVSLVSNPAMDFGGPEDVGRRVGMFLSFLALGALAGPPISGAVRTATGDFDAVGCSKGALTPIMSMDSLHADSEATRNVANVSRQSDMPSEVVPLGLQYQESSLASIHCGLPEDILREVFLHCLPTTHNSTFSPRDAPVLLTHVCRHWRDIALSTPSMWCSLHIPLGSSQDLHSAMDVWLTQAGALPLSLSFGSPTDRFSPNLADLSPYFKKLQATPNPLHTVTLELRGEEDNIKAFLEEHRQLGFSPTQTVKKLGIRIDALNPYIIQHSVLSLLKLQENRALRGLELSAAFHILALPEGFELPTPWANLQTLDLQSHNFFDGFPMAIRIGVLLSILNRCPNLVQLKAFAAGVLHTRSTMDLPDVVLHPRLRHASLFIMNLASMDNVEFLGKCDWPILTSLHLGYKGQIGSDPERGYILNKIIEKWGNALTSLRFTYPSIDQGRLLYFLSQLPQLVQLHVEDGTVRKLQVGVVSDDSDSDDEDEDPPEDDVITSLTPGSNVEASEHSCPLLQYFRWDGRTRFSDKAVISLILTRALSPASPVRMKQVVINFDRGPQEDIGAACSGLIADGLRLRLKYRVPRISDTKFFGPYRGLTVEQDPLALGWM